jgi:hypothetical protein
MQPLEVLVEGTGKANLSPLVIGADRAEADLVKQLSEFSKLSVGWDGESAARPSDDAIDDAIRFVQVAGHLANNLEPTLHADGSVILEVGDGEEGALRFRGDASVIYAIGKVPPGREPFDGFSIPQKVQAALQSL